MTPARKQPDRCPHPRPFPPGFAECPAFQASIFVAADSRNKPLGTWRSCRHLTSGSDKDQPGRFYPRCALGSHEQRLQWLGQVTPSRLEVVRALQEEGQKAPEPSSLTMDPKLEQLIHEFFQTVDSFLSTNGARLQDVGLPAGALGGLIRDWIWGWLRTPGFATARLNDGSLESFGSASRAFMASQASDAYK